MKLMKWMKWMKRMTWINEWLNEWNEWLIDWLTDWLTGSSEWVGGWMDEWVRYFFVELLLHCVTSSLRYLFSQLLLVWAACYLDYFLSGPLLLCLACLSQSSVASANQFFFPRGQHSAFCNIQLQSSVAASALLSSAQSCRCVSSQAVANPHSFDAPSNRFRTWNYWRANKSAACPPQFSAFFGESKLSLQSRAHFVDLMFQKWRAIAARSTFLNKFGLSLYTVSCIVFPDGGPQPQQTLLSRPLYSLQRHKVSRPKMSSPANSHASELLYSPLQLPVANCYCCLCGWHDDKTDHGHSSASRKFLSYVSLDYTPLIKIS